MSVRSDHLAGGDWHATEDLIELHEDGSLDLLGRADRIVKIEGNRVSLVALEERLRASLLIEDAAVVALETEPASLGAVLVLSDQGRDKLTQLGAFRLGRLLRRGLAETLAAGGLPRHWRFMPRLPISALGKSRNADLAALFATRPVVHREPTLRAQRNLGDRIALDLSIPANLPCLNGHFPRLPVVPGVAQLDWAVKFAARCFDLPLSVAQKFQIKFKRVASAPCDVTLTLTHRATEGQIAFEYSQGEAVISQGSFATNHEQ
jgi:3-hydroxymyristoyl/3-hydroxydecanoyl-(acyl carrier protein) dehydratase